MKIYPVEAYGCLGGGSRTRVDKIDIFSKSKVGWTLCLLAFLIILESVPPSKQFCIAMENSNGEHYVTEKLWHALDAGCLPIYMGAPNIVADFLPDPMAVILYNKETMTPATLANELKRLEANDTAYEEHFAWRKRPLEEQAPGFQRQMGLTKLPSTMCQLCQKVAVKRFEREMNRTLSTLRTRI